MTRGGIRPRAFAGPFALVRQSHLNRFSVLRVTDMGCSAQEEAPMDKIDFRKRDRALYQPPAGRFVPVDVPPCPT